MNLLDPLAPFKLTKDLLKLALANDTNPSDSDTYERDSASIHTAHRGDVLGIKRDDIIDYKHFAIYLGKSSVIHYAPDSSGKITIHQAPMSEFLGDSGNCDYFICNFPKAHGKPKEVGITPKQTIKEFDNGFTISLSPFKNLSILMKSINYHLYSPDETIERAKSRLGEESYNLLTNNCEYFALWCKTGISESHQVESLLNFLYPTIDISL